MTNVPDSLDKARASLNKLRDADDWDEPTGRTEIVNHIHVTPRSPKPEAPEAPISIFKHPNTKRGTIVAAIMALAVAIRMLVEVLK